MRQDFSVVRATDPKAATSTLIAAFLVDPVTRWIYETPAAYLEGFPRFAVALQGPAFDHGMTWQVGGGAGVAIWLPPGVESDVEPIVAALESTAPPEKAPEVLQLAEQIGAAHPHEPHWYLTWLAVDPARQNEGIGSRLIKHGLQKVDESGLPAYLESANPRTIPFYEHYGFEVMGRTHTPTAPPVYFMYRPGRS